MRTARWKYTAEPAPAELYDAIKDPGETVNRAAAEPDVCARMAASYEKLRAPSLAPDDALDVGLVEMAEKLAALGYVRAPQRFPAGEAPDPRRLVRAIGWIESARQLAIEGRVADSLHALAMLTESEVARPLALRSLAQLYLVVGRNDEAVQAYRQLSDLTGMIEPRVGLVNALLVADRPAEALPVVDELLQRTSAPSARLLLLRGRTMLQLERWEEAERDAVGILATDPESDAAVALAGSARLAREGAAAEIGHLRKLIGKHRDPSRLVQTRALLARLLRAERRATEAVQVLEGDDPPAEHRVILAEIAAEHGNLPRAAELYESVLATQPATQSHQLALADIYDSLGRFNDALRLYDEMIEIQPRDPVLYIDRGVARTRAGRSTEAEEDYRKAIELDDSVAEAFLNLGLIELAGGHEQEAEQHLLRAVTLRPDYAKAHFHLARLYNGRGDPRAAEHADKAVAASGR